MHQYVTHNRSYPSQKQFADAILAFMRETIPQEWTKFRDKVTDNFRVITHKNLRVLKGERDSYKGPNGKGRAMPHLTVEY